MKQTLLGILALALVACNDGQKSNGYGSGRDTAYTVVTFAYNAPDNEYRTGQAARISWDTTLPDPKDKTRNIPSRDTAFAILIVNKMLDSLGAPLKTVAGTDSFYVGWNMMNKRVIVKDYNYNYRPVMEAQLQAIKQ